MIFGMLLSGYIADLLKFLTSDYIIWGVGIMPDFMVGFLVGGLIGLFVGSFLGITIMCIVRVHSVSTIIKSIEYGKDADELI